MSESSESEAPRGIMAIASREIEKSHYQAKGFYQISNKEFLRGELLRVGFQWRNNEREDFGDGTNYIYHKNGKLLAYYRNENLLIESIGLIDTPSWFEILLRRENISGIIAMILLAFIIYLYSSATTEAKIPELISQSFATVLGFYFGSHRLGRDST